MAFALANGQSIGVLRLPATSLPSAGTPIYFIAGGPGVSGVEEAQRRPALFERLRALGEVVIVEQRGAGSSQPDMQCSERWSLPLTRAVSRAEWTAQTRDRFASCAQRLRAQGVDLSAYRTEHYAADLRAVMQQLGHSRVRLLAHSYGTMIALEFLRADSTRSDAPRAERAVLAGVMGPGDALRDPQHHERVLDTLSQDLGLATPGVLRERVAAALSRVQREPLAITLSAPEETLLFSRDDIARALVQAMGRPTEAAQLPALLQALADGSAAASHASGLPTWSQTWLETAGNGVRLARTGPINRRSAAQHYLTVCANGEPTERRAARERGQREGLFGHTLHSVLPDACDGWGTPFPPPRAAVSANTPVLLISALLDVRTPHEQALAAAKTLPQSVLLTLAGAGHGEVLGPDVALDAAIDSFLRGEPVKPQTLRIRAAVKGSGTE